MFMLSLTSRIETCCWIERINRYCAREYTNSILFVHNNTLIVSNSAQQYTNSILFVYDSAQRYTVCTQEYTDIIIGVSLVLGRRRTQRK